MNEMLVNAAILILCISIQDAATDSGGCDSPQYIKIGTTGKIKCSFPDDVYGVFWYNSTDPFQDSVILIFEDSIIKGPGFLSGEFDISHGGSLIVQNVSMRHEGTYTAVRLLTPSSKTRSYAVDVVVIAITFRNFPVIQNCNSSELCYQILDEKSQLSCTVVDSRRTIPLYWMVRTINGDRNVSSYLSVKNERHAFFTSLVTTTDFFYTPLLTLLVCKAESPPTLLEKNESLVLVQNERVPTAEQYVEYIEINSRLELRCTDKNISYLVWQRMQPSDGLYYNILYVVFVGSYSSHNDVEGYQFKNDSSLVVDAVGVHHEGVYRCISGNGLEDDMKVYNVAVFVSARLVVDGCRDQQYCVLEGNAEGSLTCMLKRVRPQVELDFTEIFQESSDQIEFFNKTLNVKDNGDTFDVFLRSGYRYKGLAKTKLTIECKVIGTNVTKLQLSRIFDLWFVHGVIAPTGETPTTNKYHWWVILAAVAAILLVLVICGFFIIKAYRYTRRSRHHKPFSSETPVPTFERKEGNNTGLSDRGFSSEEIMPLVPQKDQIVAKKDQFISELKAKYQDLCEVVQPIPFIRDRLYCVDRVFVEGGIEYLVAKNKIGEEGRWEKLDTYQNILTDDRVKSKRLIIEGDPGYGKSSLTLQLAYDWCNGTNISLKNIDILIILRLRQLGGVTSIYRAIRMFLLPKDTQLSEKEIEMILCHSSSTLVVLDGYDEYPDKDDDTDRDVISIIARNMFQQFEVILTTRSSYLPINYPAPTKRLKLTGFDDKARDQYIRKAVVGNDTDAVDKIKQRLQKNDILQYVCQVPLFFVMFAHMSHESEHFQQLDSVTKFFRYMISCFHSHMKNKMKDENVTKFELFETDHRKLDIIAFERLSAKDHKTVWRKEDLCNRLGKDFYDQYVRVGILLEEEVLDISDSPGSPEHIQYKTEVRFYHKIFCEWYAAHYLSSCFSRDDVGAQPLEQSEKTYLDDYGHFHHEPKIILDKGLNYLDYLDPFEHEYVYLFTCGLSSEPASKGIIRYLQAKKETRQFVILCLFEQKGNFDDIVEYVEYICKEGFAIRNDHSLLLQRSTIQLMKISSSHKLPISSITLKNCYGAVDLISKCIRLKSSLSLSVLHNLKAIEIWESGTIMEEDEFANIVCFAAMCKGLQDLTLSRCVVPQFNKLTLKTKDILRARKVNVYWWPTRRYRLNLYSFLWEDMERCLVITDEEYQSEVEWCTTLLES